MTTYGTHPTSPNDLAPKLEYITRGNNQHNVISGLATRRPWKQMLDLRSFNFPRKLATVTSRVRANTVYFQTNYTIVVLFSVFLSLIWNPFSLLILLALLDAKLNIAVAIVAGTTAVLSHAAVRKTEDLYHQNDKETSLLNP
ncbi:PREDICTED: PRA1 family protein F1-like [Camelina sativa]|uniref:PRA1 family protein n=1 Tax=Camelina sativa TaxID=90675 RepID=A0ABM0YAI5_CAMSA|nr:PREDICTED: PRA1 family protein F1-like [Camelina sativa]